MCYLAPVKTVWGEREHVLQLDGRRLDDTCELFMFLTQSLVIYS